METAKSGREDDADTETLQPVSAAPRFSYLSASHLAAQEESSIDD